MMRRFRTSDQMRITLGEEKKQSGKEGSPQGKSPRRGPPEGLFFPGGFSPKRFCVVMMRRFRTSDQIMIQKPR